jgi:hypothetical protein
MAKEQKRPQPPIIKPQKPPGQDKGRRPVKPPKSGGDN